MCKEDCIYKQIFTRWTKNQEYDLKLFEFRINELNLLLRIKSDEFSAMANASDIHFCREWKSKCTLE